MKKSKLTMMDLKDLHSFAEMNYSRDTTKPLATEKQTRELIEPFVQHGGWSSQEGVVHVVAHSDELSERGYQERLAVRANLESAVATFSFKNPITNEGVVITPDAVLRAHIEVHGQKITKPRFNNVSCFFRVFLMNLINGAFQTLHLPLIKAIPVEIFDYDSENERIEDCLKENQLKARGKRELTDPDLITIWMTLFSRGYSQADYQRTGMTYGGAQKAYAVCQVHAKYPELNLVNRILEGLVPLRSLDKERMRKLHKADAPIADVEAYIVSPKEANTNAPKIAGKDKIKNLAEQTPVFFIRDVCKAILADDLGALNPWSDKLRAELNEYYDSAFGTTNGVKAPTENLEVKSA